MPGNRTRLYLACGLLASAVAAAQPPAFEVASVRLNENRPGPFFCLPCFDRIGFVPTSGVQVDGSRVVIENISLDQLILTAYRLKPYQLSGPDWMTRQRVEIQARIPEGVSKSQIPEMLQALLAERFRLTLHQDNKSRPVYALVVGKNGPKLAEPAPETDLPESLRGQLLYSHQGAIRVEDTGHGPFIRDCPSGPMQVRLSRNGGFHQWPVAGPLAGLRISWKAQKPDEGVRRGSWSRPTQTFDSVPLCHHEGWGPPLRCAGAFGA